MPALYAAATPQAAVTEALFRKVPIRAAGLRTLSREDLENQALSEIRSRRDLRLIELHHPGLSRLGLEPHEITTTLPKQYPRTRLWARALHADGSWEGLVWMSRLYNTVKAYFFFGDRVGEDDWEAPGPAHPLWKGPGLKFVYQVAEEAGITITEA